MSYIRVIPRDLFNEASLLKWLGKLYLASERLPEGALTVTHEVNRYTDKKEAFDVWQNENDGSIFVDNIDVRLHGERVDIYRPLNSRAQNPLWARYKDQDVEVFDGDGMLNPAFLKLTTPKEPTTTPKINIVCGKCGSENVVRDASAMWNTELQTWELNSTLDDGSCNDCGHDRLEERPL